MTNKITTDDIINSAQFSNFAQAVKMKYWERSPSKRVLEIYLDDLLLIAWEVFHDK